MQSEKVRRLLFEFMIDTCQGSTKSLEAKLRDTLDKLAKKLSKSLSNEEEVEEYLTYVLEYIDELNKFFAKKKQGRVPYSKVFAFANKDERLSEFLFDKGAKKKLSKVPKPSELDIAGFDGNEEESKENKDIIYDNEIYGWIYSSNIRNFFFSPVVNKIVVQDINSGELFSYSFYRKVAKKKGKHYIRKSKIYKALRGKDGSEAIVAFKAYMRLSFSKKRNK